jgi:hypothetical protein
VAGGVRNRAAGWLRRRADRLDPPVSPSPGLGDPLQVALRMVIAASRHDDRGAALLGAYSVLERTDGDVAVQAALHLAVLAALSSPGRRDRDEVRSVAEYLLMREQFEELVRRAG